jgi:hypothetical protein
MTSRILAFGGACLASLLATPTEALAQSVVASFQAEYSWVLPYPDPMRPILAGPYRVRFTLYNNNTWTNDDGNGGEWDLSGTDVTLWFFSEADATAPAPPFGAATWSGRLTGTTICNGTARSPGIDPNTGYPITITGTWRTRGCP